MSDTGLLSLPWVQHALTLPGVETVLDAGNAEVRELTKGVKRLIYFFPSSFLSDLDLNFPSPKIEKVQVSASTASLPTDHLVRRIEKEREGERERQIEGRRSCAPLALPPLFLPLLSWLRP